MSEVVNQGGSSDFGYKMARQLLEKGDVVVSNAGYDLFGCVEELSDTEIEQIVATNLTSSIQLIKTVLPYMRNNAAFISYWYMADDK